ncbi:MAG: hypothetical protein COV59_01310 [Candidatus Magasanikbacteria bacterium CG11_big_fil_rev_8_21_14_0_20_39_34]|uniref:SHSP domain-containing protein n=1 Tax=Candidatus Magasanikbacteria bacterium CG11_big_fil_rev_8_21_14_0_20_39_34 TaxID=1974653 RepID=A0A2H0N627_9BACT|nr:MAG: hypothetical protein COV59_01310 [Candidatus Magasanikbacteria bacterium CG11_big_fil_rev_8_21_14_0_20_39_34]
MARQSQTKIQVNSDWHEDHVEGQLAVDVYEDDTDLIVISTMAGADTEKLEIYVHNDLLTIRGQRVLPQESLGKVHHTECFWGKFSRTIVLPVDVKGELSKAEYKNGVLTVRIPKKRYNAKIPIKVVEN